MSDWTSEYITMIEDCENREGRMTDWERTFIDSIKTQLAEGRPLSRLQTEKLNEIWERITSKG